MTKIGDALRSFNPWWERKFSVVYQEREVYVGIRSCFKLPMMIALTGLRRVGKSTLMLKIAEDYITNGMPPIRVLYFSFDDFKDVEPMQIVKEYEKIHGFDIREGNYLFLLDEIQKIDDWQNKVKVLYDLYKNRIKIILSGSESLFLKKRAKESLAGRIFTFNVNQLSFKEFLLFRGKKALVEHPKLYQEERMRLFKEYMHTQGFPELVDVKDKELIRKYIREGIIDKVVYKDIPQLFKIGELGVLESLINLLMDEPGQLIELSGLASELKVTRQTLSNYITYLEESQLVKKLYNYSRNGRKTERKLKKYYPAIISVDLSFGTDKESQSKAFEWLLVTRLGAEFFWRDVYKNEVDVVLGKKVPVPIEIKYGKISTEGLSAFMHKFQVSEGIIASFDREDTIRIQEGLIRIIPAPVLLLEGKKPA
jgi:predicted AAA+ superfamily ATPase